MTNKCTRRCTFLFLRVQIYVSTTLANVAWWATRWQFRVAEVVFQNRCTLGETWERSIFGADLIVQSLGSFLIEISSPQRRLLSLEQTVLLCEL